MKNKEVKMNEPTPTHNNTKASIFYVIIIIILIVLIIHNIAANDDNPITPGSSSLHILSSYDNSTLEDSIDDYARKEHINIAFTYMGDLDIVDELNQNPQKYDAVWLSNSMWLYMLDNTSIISNSKSTSISPVVVGIKKNKAKELGITNKDITNQDILNLISNQSIKYVMSSVTRTNNGATAYFGFLNALAGNPEVLTTNMLQDETLINNLTSIFSGVERVSGDETYLKDMFLNNTNYEAVIASESSLININQTLENQGKEPLYLLYPTDGVAINDSPLALISNKQNKKDTFLKIQSYLLSNEGQQELAKQGRRTWYGGINNNADTTIFNPNWGIDTTTYLNVTKFPSKTVMTDAINLYIEKIRKPTHVIFCLDYSGSMYGDGIKALRNSMNYILDYDQAKEDKLQFSEQDKITIITFSDGVTNTWTSSSGYNTTTLRKNIYNYPTGGGTALYDAIIKGLNTLKEETDDYTKTIIAMTDGEVNIGSFHDLEKTYHSLDIDIPIYSITFGNAVEQELKEIANLSNAKVFDGKTNLLQAFKEVRGYN